VHVEAVALSPVWVYRVIPFGPVRKEPRLGEVAVPIVTELAAADPAAALAGAALAGAVAGAVVAPLAEHPAKTIMVRTKAEIVRRTGTS
jgi:hypothetical protein